MQHPAPALIKAIGLPSAVALGLTGVVGSGIFVLFSQILQNAGGYAALAVLLAAIPNIMGALSYAELGGLYQKNDTEDAAVREAFGNTASNITTYLLLLFLLFNTATVILFCGHFIPAPYRKAGMLAFLLVLTAINVRGVQLSTQLNEVVAYLALGMFGLLVASSVCRWDLAGLIRGKGEPPRDLAMATALSLFLFTGYDAIVKMSEETIEPSKTIPRAFVYTITIVTLLYMGLAMAAQSVRPFSTIAHSHMPVTELAGHIWGSQWKHIATGMGVFVCICTALVGMLGVSRFIYGLAKSERLPVAFATINESFHTPHVAILTVFAAFAAIVLCVSGLRSAMLTNAFFMMFLIIIHAAVLVLKRNKENVDERPFKTPDVVQWTGIASSLGFAIYLGTNMSRGL